MKYLTALLVVTAFLVFAQQPQPAPSTAAPQEQKSSPFDSLTLLGNSFVVLTVGDMAATWGEVKPYIPALRPGAPSSQASQEKLAQQIQTFLQKAASRGLLLQECNAKNIQLTDDDRRLIIEDLENNLKNSSAPMTLEQFKKRFSTKQSTLIKLTFEDSMRIVKLDRTISQSVRLTKEEMDKYLKCQRELQKMADQKNQETRARMETLSKNPKLRQPEGFMELARQYSQGKEAPTGGVIPVDLSRVELCDLNKIKEFPWGEGEVTPLFETPSAFRLMFVLKVLPPKKEGDQEVLHLAQVLMGKVGAEIPQNEAEIEKQILPRKKLVVIDNHVKELASRTKVHSPLFPDGLWHTQSEKTTQHGTPSQKKPKVAKP